MAETLFHVLSAEAWATAQAAGRHAPPELARDGFLHCCTRAQLGFVLARHFAGRGGMLAMRFRPELCGAAVEWVRSEPDQAPFPHLRGAVPVAAVVEVVGLDGLLGAGDGVCAGGGPAFASRDAAGPDIAHLRGRRVSKNGRVEFRSRRGWRRLLVELAIGVGAILLVPRAFTLVLPTKAPGEPPSALETGLLMLLVLLGEYRLYALAGSLPRLGVNRNGLAVRGAFWIRIAGWDAIGPFVTIPARWGRCRRAVAPRLSPGRLGWRPVGIVLPDLFEVPLPALLESLAALRPGGASAALLPPVAPPRPCGVPGFRWPWLTAALLATQVGVFVLERQVAGRLGTVPGGSGNPSDFTLLALGGLNRRLVQAGEWHRMLCAALLHADAVQLCSNAVVLALAGCVLERLLGRAWMFCVFSLGALAGSVASIALGAPAMVSVGASGAITALVAALLVVRRRMSPGLLRTQMQLRASWVTLVFLIPFGTGGTGVRIDDSVHLGGALLGGTLGLLLLAFWRDDRPVPDLRALATGICVLSVVAFAGSAAEAALHFPGFVAAKAELIPDERLPQAPGAVLDRFLADYPRDPRAHLMVATQLMQRGDTAEAVARLRVARTLLASHPYGLQPTLDNTIIGYLAIALQQQGHAEEAKRLAAPACAATAEDAPSAELRLALAMSGLCGQASVAGGGMAGQ